jgi:F0F1-type ATP synthase assembly protein I
MIDPSDLRKAAFAASLVTQAAALAGVGLLIGYQLDRAFDTAPIGLGVGVFVGFGLGMGQLLRTVLKVPDDDSPDPPP